MSEFVHDKADHPGEPSDGELLDLARAELAELAVDRIRFRTALRIAREGYASEAATGLPVLPQWRERVIALIDEAMRDFGDLRGKAGPLLERGWD